MKIKASYFFPNFFGVLITFACMGVVALTVNMTASSAYEDRVMFNGLCSAKVDPNKDVHNVECGKYMFTEAPERQHMYKLLRSTEPTKINCKVLETYDQSIITRCNWDT